MLRIAVATAIALAVSACVAMTSDDKTSSEQQDVTGRTCTPQFDAHGAYASCYVVESSGSYVVHGLTQSDCTTCGLAVSRNLCSEYNPMDTYCDNLPGPGHGVGDPCAGGCFQDASGTCHC